MTEQQTSYRQIFKATSLFGGVQIITIIITIVRSKIIAVLLGPYGMGIAGLLNSTTGIIGSVTNFGLANSAVKDIAAANATNNPERINKVIAVLKKLVWITGLLGVVVTLVFSPLLSRIVFGNSNYTIAFLLISVTLLATQLSNAQMVILQGMRKIKLLAKVKIIGSVAGLLFSVPIYYIWGIEGIVFAIIITSIVSLIVSWSFVRTIKIDKVKVNYRTVKEEGSGMLKMGFVMSLTVIISLGASYLLNIFISRVGGVSEVGLFNAGFSIISVYVGLIFTAMTTDYYPRLSAVGHDNIKSNQLINQQAEIATLILGPIISFFLIFIYWVLILLYSTKFIPVDAMIHFAAIGILFKSASWAISTVFVAKGDTKTYFWNEVVASSYLLLFNLAGYYLKGLDGLGISFLLSYILYFLQVYFVAKAKYNFALNHEFYKIFLIQLGICIMCLFTTKFFTVPASIIIGIPIIALSLWFSYYQLKKKLNIPDIRTIFIKRKD